MISFRRHFGREVSFLQLDGASFACGINQPWLIGYTSAIAKVQTVGRRDRRLVHDLVEQLLQGLGIGEGDIAGAFATSVIVAEERYYLHGLPAVVFLEGNG